MPGDSETRPMNCPHCGKDVNAPYLVPTSFESDFAARWELYPNKDGRKAAARHWKASVKTSKDVQEFDRALSNYLEHLHVTGYRAKQGATWFNNWRDWVDWKEPDYEAFGERQRLQRLARPIITAESEAKAEAEHRRFMGEV